ncbi:MAG: hypothetical protein MUF38_04530 [Anaerolineae bacterium]|jgi:hypothetical protein|nr:hypothetical protein [Anaerolineae bacterium]
MSRAIPPRQPVGDPFTGALLRVGYVYLLAASLSSEVEPVFSGQLTVRYGLRYLGKPFLAVVPALVALDYGDFLTGDAAWEFLTKRSNLYPRSDVIGYRHDGTDEMIPVKQLDLAIPPMALAYSDAESALPLAEVTGLVGAEEAFPARLCAFLARYDTLADFWAAQQPSNPDADAG